VIYIRVELHPFGYREHERFRVLCEAEIENIGGTKSRGNYRYRLFGQSRRLMRTGEVYGYRRIAQHTWYLVLMVILHAMRKPSEKTS
jgi:plasmid stabilization system protein ParE